MKQGSKLKKLALAAVALVLVGSAPMLMAQPQPRKDDSSASKDKKPALYPDATRKEPKLDLTSQKEADQLNKGLDAVNSDDTKTAQAILQPIADGTASKSKYAQALALQGLASLDYNQQNVKGAIDLISKALDNGVLPNDTYFQLMYAKAQYLAADNQYQPALDVLHKWRTEGKRETADSYGLEGILDYQLQKYKEAIAAIEKAKSMTDKPKQSWDQVLSASYAESGQSDKALQLAQEELAKNPKDATTLHNAITLMVQAQRYPEALKLMEQERSNGMMQSQKDYVNMAKLYLLVGQDSEKDIKADALKADSVLDEGLSKGVIKPSYDVYKLQGQTAAFAGNNSKAVKAYDKASAMATDGEADLYNAQLLNDMRKYSAGRRAAKKAISRGVKHMGSAYMLLAQAERALGNKPAAVRAMQKAAEYPETKSRAKAWLKNAGK